MLIADDYLLYEFKDLRFDNPRQLGQSIFKTAAHVGSRSAVVIIYLGERATGSWMAKAHCVGLLKMLMLVLIGRSQNAQCTTVCCCFGSKRRTKTILGRWS